METILLVDDDIELCGLLREYLSNEGYEVEAVHSGSEGLERTRARNYDLLVLDIMLPDVQGLNVLRSIRAESRLPVLMLTARGNEMDRIIGLEIGADDYLPKPCNPRELAARVRSILRRGCPEHGLARPPERIVAGDLELHPGSRTARKNGRNLDLTVVEYDLLQILAQSAGQVVTRENLVKSVLGRDFSPYDHSIDVHVSNLRKKVGRLPGGTERIRNVRGVGYLYALESHD
jgi:DNA-binding response OmpR family regulator